MPEQNVTNDLMNAAEKLSVLQEDSNEGGGGSNLEQLAGRGRDRRRLDKNWRPQQSTDSVGEPLDNTSGSGGGKSKTSSSNTGRADLDKRKKKREMHDEVAIEERRNAMVDAKWGFEVTMPDGTTMIMQNRHGRVSNLKLTLRAQRRLERRERQLWWKLSKFIGRSYTEGKKKFWAGLWKTLPKRRKVPKSVELDPVTRTFTLGTKPPRLIRSAADMLPYMRDEV